MMTQQLRSVRDSYDSILSFSRASRAYDSQGRRYDLNNMRFEPSRFGMAARVEEGTTNHTVNGLFTAWVGAVPDGWTGTATKENSELFPGAYQARITDTDGATYQGVLYQTTPAVPATGTTYTLSTLIKAYSGSPTIRLIEGTNTSPTKGGQAKLNAGVWATSVFGDCTATCTQKDHTVPGWQVVTLTVTFPTGATELRIVLYGATPGASVGDMSICAVQLEAKAYATTFTLSERKPELLTIPVSVPDVARPTNLLSEEQSSAESGPANWVLNSGNGARSTWTRTSEQAWHGSQSIRIDQTEAASSWTNSCGMTIAGVTLKPNATYTLSARVRGVAEGTVRVYLRDNSVPSGTYASVAVNASGWATLTVTKQVGAAPTSLGIWFYSDAVLSFYVDGLQLEESATTTDWCLGGHRGILGPSVGTVDFWAYIHAVTRRADGTNFPMLFGINAVDNATAQRYRLYHQASATNWTAYVSDGLGGQSYSHAADSNTPDGWHHFQLKWSPTEMKMLIDGQVRVTVTNPGLCTRPFDKAWIGCPAGAPNQAYANTIYDDIRFSRTYRSDAEALALYNSNAPAPYDADTTYLWRADGPSAQRVTQAVVL